MEKIRILIGDDHAALRASTRKLLESEVGFEVVAEAEDGEEAVKLATSLSPDVVVIDIVMPKIDGIQATRQIKSHCPDTAVVIYTLYDDDPFVLRSLEAGADGYLLKSARRQELIRAVREAHAREFSLNRWLAGVALERLREREHRQVVSGTVSDPVHSARVVGKLGNYIGTSRTTSWGQHNKKPEGRAP